MRIVVIGGGAGGLVAAWSLAGAHEVWLLEAQPMLGGNIRTLGRNVHPNVRPDLAAGLHLDAGVVEFPKPWFPRFHALMHHLGVELAGVPGTSAYFPADGRQFFTPQALLHTTHHDVRWKLRALARLTPLLGARQAFLQRTQHLTEAQLYAHRFVDFLEPGDLRMWLKLLCTYAWSIPLADVDDIPAALAVPVMRSIVSNIEWSGVVGGAYAYVEKIVAQLETGGAHIQTQCAVRGVTRGPEGVRVAMPDGSVLHCDAVVLAVTPDHVLSLLHDADEKETRWFAPWRGNDAVTVLHMDTGLYARRGVSWYSEFDVFETGANTGGYNAYLNRLNQVPEGRGHFSLALAMDHEVDPEKVIHRQEHHSPRYTVDALAQRPDVLAHHGHRATWYAGAWLGDGLHEGAVVSGLAVGAQLGGRTLLPNG